MVDSSPKSQSQLPSLPPPPRPTPPLLHQHNQHHTHPSTRILLPQHPDFFRSQTAFSTSRPTAKPTAAPTSSKTTAHNAWRQISPWSSHRWNGIHSICGCSSRLCQHIYDDVGAGHRPTANRMPDVPAASSRSRSRNRHQHQHQHWRFCCHVPRVRPSRGCRHHNSWRNRRQRRHRVRRRREHLRPV